MKDTGCKDEKILAFDTAMSACSVSFYDEGTDRFFSETVPMSRGQAEHLVPMIERVMGQAGIAYDSLDRIVTTIGPGAFTGLRIGLSVARALSVALDRPLAGVTTLDVLARQYMTENPMQDTEQLLVLLETKRQDFYYQLFSADGQALMPAGAAVASDICSLITAHKKTVLIGDATNRFCNLTASFKCGELDFRHVDGDRYTRIDPVFIIKSYCAGFYTESSDPLYLREADVSLSKKKYRKMKQDN